MLRLCYVQPKYLWNCRALCFEVKEERKLIIRLPLLELGFGSIDPFAVVSSFHNW